MATKWFANSRPQIRSNTVCAALRDRMASSAFFENGFAFGHIGSCHHIANGNISFAAVVTGLNALNRIARLMRRGAVKIHARSDAQSQRGDTTCQNPACDCVTAIIHRLSALLCGLMHAAIEAARFPAPLIAQREPCKSGNPVLPDMIPSRNATPLWIAIPHLPSPRSKR